MTGDDGFDALHDEGLVVRGGKILTKYDKSPCYTCRYWARAGDGLGLCEHPLYEPKYTEADQWCPDWSQSSRCNKP